VIRGRRPDYVALQIARRPEVDQAVGELAVQHAPMIVEET
jgi:hypothetical protein